jgi:hypothetical protein
MGVLITLKPIRLNGEIVQPGTMVRVENEQGLTDRGCARHLNPEETQEILSEYVKYAEMIFGETTKVLPARVKQADCRSRPYGMGKSPNAEQGCSHPKATLVSRRSDVSNGVKKP